MYLAGLLTLMFCKEYIIMNQELIIYLTFIGLVFIFTWNISLVNIFDDLRQHEIKAIISQTENDNRYYTTALNDNKILISYPYFIDNDKI